MSQDLISRHGALQRVDYVSHFPDFEIYFTYEDGTKLYSGKRTGNYDIHFLTLGYVGEGPRYAHHFLKAAGLELSSDEIESIRPGDCIVPRDGKAIIVRKGEPIPPESAPDNADASQTRLADGRIRALFAQSIFDFDFAEQSEDRDWKSIPELKQVPTLFQQNDIAKLEERLRQALHSYSDYAFVYHWMADVLEKKNDIDGARNCILEGIKNARKKYSLCGSLGMLEYNHGNIREAVKWWVRSVIFQKRNNNIGSDTQSFLYLGFIASLYHQLSSASEELMDCAARGIHGRIDLNPTRKTEVSRKLSAANSADIPDAIRELIGALHGS
jgi:tetratricopeptide (TPR) repeat protein